MNEKKGLSDDSLRADGSQGISANESLEVLADAQFHTKASLRRSRHGYIEHLTGIHAGHLNFGPLGKSSKVGEIGIIIDVAGESLMAIADENQTGHEER
jgi:hypothetical protein